MNIKNKNQKDSKEKYEEIVKLVEEAKNEAEKFIKANKHIDPQLRIKQL